MTVCVTLAGWVLPNGTTPNAHRASGALAILFGDGRRLLANEFMSKADAYFHRGRYPSFFEQAAQQEQENHLVESVGTSDGGQNEGTAEHEADEDGHGHEGEHEDLHMPSGPDDWIARLAARLKPNVHVHLQGGNEREMLPWVKLAVELNPHDVDAYTVGGYWLWKLGKTNEAQQFLREGQRNNPNSYRIYFELARHAEEESQLEHARRLYQLALQIWQKVNQGQENVDAIFYGRILGRLAQVEELQGNTARAIQYLKLLLTVTPNPEPVRKHIQRLESSLQAGEKE
jgi:tetratricopeptide (TPR) repeat protein